MMFVLYYFAQDQDLSDVEVLAVSKVRGILEQKKRELLAESTAYTAKYNAWVTYRKEILLPFLNRQKQALVFGKVSFNTPEKYIEWLVNTWPWTDFEQQKSYFDPEKVLDEPLLAIDPMPKPDKKLYYQGNWGGIGLNIEEVDELTEFAYNTRLEE